MKEQHFDQRAHRHAGLHDVADVRRRSLHIPCSAAKRERHRRSSCSATVFPPGRSQRSRSARALPGCSSASITAPVSSGGSPCGQAAPRWTRGSRLLPEHPDGRRFARSGCRPPPARPEYPRRQRLSRRSASSATQLLRRRSAIPLHRRPRLLHHQRSPRTDPSPRSGARRHATCGRKRKSMVRILIATPEDGGRRAVTSAGVTCRRPFGGPFSSDGVRAAVRQQDRLESARLPNADTVGAACQSQTA